MEIIGWLLFGLVVGAIARLLVPGRDPMGWLGTMLLGIAGSLVGAFLARALFGDENGVGWFGAIVGAVLLLFVWRAVVERRPGMGGRAY